MSDTPFDRSADCDWLGYPDVSPLTAGNFAQGHTCPQPYCYACRINERDEARRVAISLLAHILHPDNCVDMVVSRFIRDYPWLAEGSG